MLKFKNSIQSIETPYALHAEQGHGKLLLNSSSLLKQSSRRNSHF